MAVVADAMMLQVRMDELVELAFKRLSAHLPGEVVSYTPKAGGKTIEVRCRDTLVAQISACEWHNCSESGALRTSRGTRRLFRDLGRPTDPELALNPKFQVTVVRPLEVDEDWWMDMDQGTPLPEKYEVEPKIQTPNSKP